MPELDSGGVRDPSISPEIKIAPATIQLEDLILTWRARLVDQQADVVAAVADEVARVMSQTRLAALESLQQENVRRLQEAAGAVGRRIAEQQAEYWSQVQHGLVDRMVRLIEPAARLATERLAAALRAYNAEERRNAEALRRLGWWVPWSAPADVVLEIGRLASRGRKLRVRQAMNELTMSRLFRRIVEDEWLSLDVFSERRLFFREALTAHRKRRYRVSILLLLPHLEGIAFAAFAPGDDRSDPRVAIRMAGLDYQELASDGLLDAITVLYAGGQTFAPTTTGNPLNRHVILHGRRIDFATEVNSTKVLMAFDLLAQVVRMAEERAARSTPPPLPPRLLGG